MRKDELDAIEAKRGTHARLSANKPLVESFARMARASGLQVAEGQEVASLLDLQKWTRAAEFNKTLPKGEKPWTQAEIDAQLAGRLRVDGGVLSQAFGLVQADLDRDADVRSMLGRDYRGDKLSDQLEAARKEQPRSDSHRDALRAVWDQQESYERRPVEPSVSAPVREPDAPAAAPSAPAPDFTRDTLSSVYDSLAGEGAE